MAKKKRSKKLQKKQRAHARAALKRAQRTARRAQAAKERAASAPSSAHPRTSNPLPALAYTVPYENASRVFGRAMEPQELVDRIACYDWRASMGKLAYLSSILGNGDGDRAQQMMIGGIRALRASTPGSASLVAHAKRFVNASSGPLLIAHEEALLFLQHVIVLHAPDIDGGPPPGDGEVALWLLAASDHLDQWAEEDTRPLTKSEELLAEQIKVFRYNRRGDPMRTALRTYRTFLDPPRTGTLSVPSTWEAIQREAFHGSYREYFERFALPVFSNPSTSGVAGGS